MLIGLFLLFFSIFIIFTFTHLLVHNYNSSRLGPASGTYSLKYRVHSSLLFLFLIHKEKKIVKLAKIDYKLRRMDSDNQFVAQEVNGGIRTIGETVSNF